jgi:hypothetical protein
MRFVDDHKEEIIVQNPEDQDGHNRRFVHTKHGFSIKLERRDPYGFVYIVWHSGPTPVAISGAYSDFDTARAAVNNYINTETFNKVVEDKVEKPELKYKKVK